ncbi:signal peptidase I [Terrabacter sp. BE26]|uniref:signal peptidase I n=1 Tax=Terrabacter sp. BE26 TaxID=2898152 RepID=UPI0035BE59AB
MLAVGLAVGSHWVVEPVRVTSDSMSPTLSPGDRVVLLRSPWAGTVSRGDVVVVGPGWAERAERAASSRSEAAQAPTDTSWVKRVVALGGDAVGLEDGRLVVNGAPAVEPWVDEESMDGVWFGPVTVPAGAVFVMGDDRARSVDSRVLGPVLLDELDGRVVTPWPLS